MNCCVKQDADALEAVEILIGLIENKRYNLSYLYLLTQDIRTTIA